MVEILVTHDIEDALQSDLSRAVQMGGFSIGISATPVPEDLGKTIPYAVVTKVGGSRSDTVLDEHIVSIDVWDKRWALSIESANKLAGYLMALPDMPNTSIDYLKVTLDTTPYNNPDVRHVDLPRVTFIAAVLTRPAVIAID